eukprot:CAMPEP_0113692708 /NCGR_PEP_ID=MMETSP0038_2-20120614/19247_1 /TAXON_ID=2898 /ORGANISM="Cryptomonas paramecium" /LENGTH=264 /DNA_ID=CAMNT_0000614675 /DNA_START=213 /DNA_END=1004 /DNA_ORIENTATION=- /assembly_acc=CAM_ASM_000170
MNHTDHHQRNHKPSSSGLGSHGFGVSNSIGGLHGHNDMASNKSVGNYGQSSVGDFQVSNPLGWHSPSTSPHMTATSAHHASTNGSARNGHAFSGHAKRQRGLDVPPLGSVPSSPHHDALMELARENLLLKHQLHVAHVEVSRLKNIVESYEQSEESKETTKSQSRYWTEEEHQRFLEAIQTIGHKDVKAIAQFVGTRNSTQVRTHAQKYFMKLARLKKQEEDGGCGGPSSNPDQEPSEAGEDNANTSIEAAAAVAAASGEAGTS